MAGEVQYGIRLTANTAPLRTQFGEAATSSDRLSDALRKVGHYGAGLLGLSSAAQGLAALGRTADTYDGIAARLKLATSSAEEYRIAQAGVYSNAQAALAPLAETAQMYTRVAGAVKNLGGAQRETLGITEAVTKALRISGATSAETAATVTQFSQALGSGVLRGDEFRSLMEAAPRLMQAVAEGMGRSKEQLRGLAEQGKLTSDIVGNSLLKALPQLRSEFERIPVTISGAFQRVSNAFLQYVGETNQASGASTAFARTLSFVAEHMKALGDAALLTGGVILASLGGRAVASVAQFAAAQTALAAATSVSSVAMTGAAGIASRVLGILGGPVGLVATIALGAAAWLSFGREAERALESTEQRVARLKKEQADARKGTPAEEVERIVKAGAQIGNLEAKKEASNSETYQAQLQKEINLLKEEQQLRADRLAKNMGGAPGESAGPLTPVAKSVEEVTKDLKTRTGILREYQQTSLDLNRAFRAAVEQATGAGDTKRARDLAVEVTEARVALKKTRDDALNGLTSNDALKSQTALVKERAETILNTEHDALDRGQRYLDESLKRDLVSYGGYFDAKQALSEAGVQAEIRAREMQLGVARKNMATANPGPQRDERLAEVRALEGEIERLHARSADVMFQIDTERFWKTRELEQRSTDSYIAALQQREENQAAMSAVATARAADLEATEQRLRFRTQDIGVAMIEDTRARAQAQLAIEREREAQDIALKRLGVTETKHLLDQSAEYYVLRQRQLTQELRPEWQKMLDQWGDTARLMRTTFDDFVSGGLRSGEEAFVRFAQTGKLEISNLANFVIGEMARMQFRQNLAPALSTGLQWLGEAIFGGSTTNPSSVNYENSFDSGALAAVMKHSGGMGSEPGPTRTVPASVFYSAPRFHNGIGPGERAAIIRDDEAVLTPGQMGMLAPVGAGAGGIAIDVRVTNQGTPKRATVQGPPSFDGRQYVVNLLLEDQRDGGQYSQAMERTYGLQRRV